MKEHIWNEQMRCELCGLWAMTYEVRFGCKGSEADSIEEARQGIDWFGVARDFSA